VSDTLQDELLAAGQTPTIPLTTSGERQCEEPGCEEPRKNDKVNTRYCEEHSALRRKRPVGGTRPRSDKAPRSINVNLGQPKATTKDKQLQAVEDRARQLVQIAAALVLLAGQVEDSADIAKGSEVWATSVRDLAQHEAWLRKIASGGEASARAVAWLQFVVASLAIALPILLRHGALPANIAKVAEQFIGVAETLTVTDVPTAEQPDDGTSVAA